MSRSVPPGEIEHGFKMITSAATQPITNSGIPEIHEIGFRIMDLALL